MIDLKPLVLAFGVAVAAGAVHAQSQPFAIGGDIFTTGESGSPLQAGRDVLAAGSAVYLGGTVAQDTHATGFDVEVDASTGGDLFAAGATVSLRGAVAGDLTAAGFNVRTARAAEVGGNARLTGGRVVIDGPVRGALAAAGGTIALNSAVSGDAVLLGETITFGPDASIAGRLTYSAPAPIEIPARVVPADRITFTAYERSEMVRDAGQMWDDWKSPATPGFGTLLGGFLVTLGFLVVIGALFLSMAPAQVRRLRQSIEARPGAALLGGVIGLSTLFGLVPLSIMTVVGIPFVPIVVLIIILAWTLGYLLGAYVVAMRVMRAFGASDAPGMWMRLLALVLGVTLMALLNFIPVLGWVANLGLVLLGIGGMTMSLAARMGGRGSLATTIPEPPAVPSNKE